MIPQDLPLGKARNTMIVRGEDGVRCALMLCRRGVDRASYHKVVVALDLSFNVSLAVERPIAEASTPGSRESLAAIKPVVTQVLDRDVGQMPLAGLKQRRRTRSHLIKHEPSKVIELGLSVLADPKLEEIPPRGGGYQNVDPAEPLEWPIGVLLVHTLVRPSLHLIAADLREVLPLAGPLLLKLRRGEDVRLHAALVHAELRREDRFRE